MMVLDAGYDVTRLAFLLAGLPVRLCGRLRSDRVLCFPAPQRGSGRARPSRHGPELRLADQAELARACCDHGDRDGPLRHCHRHVVGPAAPAAGQPRHPGRS
ncbi:MAG: transposase [Streptosporangiaceae bacterium]